LDTQGLEQIDEILAENLIAVAQPITRRTVPWKGLHEVAGRSTPRSDEPSAKMENEIFAEWVAIACIALRVIPVGNAYPPIPHWLSRRHAQAWGESKLIRYHQNGTLERQESN
jgi:hypothetical protein